VTVYPHPLHDARGQVTGAVNMLVDITDRKRAETALRESEAFARSVLEGSADCIQVLDSAGRLLSMNGPGMRLMEIEDFQSVAQTDWLAFWKGEHHVAARAALETGRAGGTGRFQGICHTATGKPKWWDVALSPISSSEGQAPQLVCISRDITESKKAELALQEAKEAAEAVSKAKDNFLATLSHELRTPLNPALLLASERERDSNLSADVRRDFAAIHKDIKMEARLIDDLLDLTRISHGKRRLEPRPIDLHSLLLASWERLKTEADEKQLHVCFELAAPTPWVQADPVRLQQIFSNVLKNALRFIPAQGQIILRSYGGKPGYWCADIIDNGVGIESHELERIFTPFDQGQNGDRFGGIGLGLAISRQLIELHGGRITAMSEGRGRGAVFTLELPAAQPAVEDPGVSSSNTGNKRRDMARRILLAEDHNQTRATLARLLTQRGHEVATAENIEEALVCAQTFAFDLVLSDLGLPDGSGHDLITELRQMRPGCRSIALSGYGMESDAQRSLDSGFDAHLTKPVDIQALEIALNPSLDT
jgi:PAS domain S-box-containing protein